MELSKIADNDQVMNDLEPTFGMGCPFGQFTDINEDEAIPLGSQSPRFEGKALSEVKLGLGPCLGKKIKSDCGLIPKKNGRKSIVELRNMVGEAFGQTKNNIDHECREREVPSHTAMKVLTWNVRGLNTPNKQRILKHCIFASKIDIALIQEMKLSQSKIGIFRKKLGLLELDAIPAMGASDNFKNPLSNNCIKSWRIFNFSKK